MLLPAAVYIDPLLGLGKQCHAAGSVTLLAAAVYIDPLLGYRTQRDAARSMALRLVP